MIFQSLSYIMVFIILIVIMIDLVPIIKDWVLRIHIGRFENKFIWDKAITKKGSRWLLNAPKIKVTDNTRLVVIDMLKGNYTNSTIQNWQEASLVLGLSEYLKNSNDDDVTKNKIVDFLDLKFDSNGQWLEKPKYVDGAILAYSIMKLDFIDVDKYKSAFDYTWEIIKSHIGEEGTVEYRRFMESYRYVDTIGFICPFLVCYGIRYKKDQCIDLAVKQIEKYEKYGMLDTHYIPYHVYKIENQVPLGLPGWGRGLGWFAIGLIDAWDELPHNNEYKLALEKSIKRFAVTVMDLQQANGSWNWTVTRSESRPDSSTTAMLGWFMFKSSKIEGISKRGLESTDRAMSYLMRVTRRDGAIDFSQGDTKDIGVYSMVFNVLPFTQGLCIRLTNAYLNKKDDSK
ncbi:MULTISPECIES: glycoside hydrolase family 88 protein [Bacillus]|uniref:Unsaturated rhamnogalacturonyl hydrolase n=2 Tax=Bacillus cereus group TaxID=86661 RepID=A0A2C1D9F8_BACCE|nr:MULTISPECIES: glycoside hydrolase family 88 protein [Bacillus cereus group]OFD74952.1 hypothetical protein BWGOE9_37830 [Bacillus mycoides]OFD75066.1 hypothetical protein BWGOE8_37150 [Bacillus mycoides]OFD76588.1 hypothetical protein BWGOE10_37850 [Bacillus mycoides]PGS96513.1 hypothetical protein COD09_21720 [Bacillus cereus]